jgi:hypothetical protein
MNFLKEKINTNKIEDALDELIDLKKSIKDQSNSDNKVGNFDWIIEYEEISPFFQNKYTDINIPLSEVP